MKFIKNHLKKENKDEVVRWIGIIIGFSIFLIINMQASFDGNTRYFFVDAITFLILLCWLIENLKKFHKISIGYVLKIAFLCAALLFYIQKWMMQF